MLLFLFLFPLPFSQSGQRASKAVDTVKTHQANLGLVILGYIIKADLTGHLGKHYMDRICPAVVHIASEDMYVKVNFPPVVLLGAFSSYSCPSFSVF